MTNNKLLNNINFESLNEIDVYIYGCSHCKCFTREKNIKLNNITIHNMYRSSSSMSGITKDVSTLNYKKLIDIQINNNISNYYIFKFGQVDIEYIYYYKTIKLEEDIEKLDFYNNIINKYIDFLCQYKEINNNIFVCGSNLANPSGSLRYISSIIHVSYEKTKHISLDVRNRDIIMFNKILLTKCVENNIIYFDLIEETSNNFIVNDEFIGCDHHYKGAEMMQPYNKIIAKPENIDYGLNTHTVFCNKLFKIIGCDQKNK